MRFFAARSARELEQLAMIDPDIGDATDALKRLSSDPVAQDLAREREIAARFYERSLRLAREEGEARGRRSLLRRQLASKFGDLPEQAEARLDTATEAELARWAEQILTASSIDDALA